jgi:hypothetical protein
LRIADEVQEPAQKAEAVASTKAEPHGEWHQSVRKCAGIIVDIANCVRDDMGHRFGLLAIRQKIGGDSARPRHREAPNLDPLGCAELATVETHVGSPRLFPDGYRELMAIGWQVAQSIERRRRAMGHDSLLRFSLPRWDVRGKLQPGGPELDVIWRWGAGQPVYAVRHPFQD